MQRSSSWLVSVFHAQIDVPALGPWGIAQYPSGAGFWCSPSASLEIYLSHRPAVKGHGRGRHLSGSTTRRGGQQPQIPPRALPCRWRISACMAGIHPQQTSERPPP